MIKPYRIYIANRTKCNFYHAIENQNKIVRDHSPHEINKSNIVILQTQSIQRGKPTKEEQLAFQTSINSYLGIMKHYKSYKLRKEMLFKNLSAWWWNYFYLSGGIEKFKQKHKIKKNHYL